MATRRASDGNIYDSNSDPGYWIPGGGAGGTSRSDPSGAMSEMDIAAATWRPVEDGDPWAPERVRGVEEAYAKGGSVNIKPQAGRRNYAKGGSV